MSLIRKAKQGRVIRIFVSISLAMLIWCGVEGLIEVTDSYISIGQGAETAAQGLGILLAVAGVFYPWVHGKASEFLIETEAELRRVVWPIEEAARGFWDRTASLRRTTHVVLVCVFFLGLFLFISDGILGKAMRFLQSPS